MNTAKLRTKRVLIPTAVVLALGIGGVAWATTATADNLGGSERDRVVAAAKDAVGGGEVVSAESSDRDDDDRDLDDRNEAYEVEIRKADGTEVDVSLDKDLKVIGQDTDDDGRDDSDDRDDDGRDDDADDRNDTPDADDRALSAAERTSAEKAATTAVGGGTVTGVEASDDRVDGQDVAYDVEIRTADGTEWDVDLAADFSVIRKSVDR